MIDTVSDVIELFGGPAKYAREVGMTPGAAKQAARRKSLKTKWIEPTAKAAERLGLNLDQATLLRVAVKPEDRVA